MKLLKFSPVLVIIFILSCISMPKPVSDKYLVNKTNEQAVKLEQIENQIIDKKKEKDKVKIKLKTAQKYLKQKNLNKDSLDKEKDFLIAEEKKYTSNENIDKLSEVQSKLATNQNETKKNNAYLEYAIVKKFHEEINLEMASSELAVLVAARQLERAIIAHAFLEKKRIEEEKKAVLEKKDNEKEEEKEKKETLADKLFGDSKKDAIDLESYEKYLQKQKDDLRSITKKQQESQKELKKAEQKLQKAGYEVEK